MATLMYRSQHTIHLQIKQSRSPVAVNISCVEPVFQTQDFIRGGSMSSERRGCRKIQPKSAQGQAVLPLSLADLCTSLNMEAEASQALGSTASMEPVPTAPQTQGESRSSPTPRAHLTQSWSSCFQESPNSREEPLCIACAGRQQCPALSAGLGTLGGLGSGLSRNVSHVPHWCQHCISCLAASTYQRK